MASFISGTSRTSVQIFTIELGLMSLEVRIQKGTKHKKIRHASMARSKSHLYYKSTCSVKLILLCTNNNVSPTDSYLFFNLVLGSNSL